MPQYSVLNSKNRKDGMKNNIRNIFSDLKSKRGNEGGQQENTMVRVRKAVK